MHETIRIFFDRLTTDQDRKWFKETLIKNTCNIFKIEITEDSFFDEEDNTLLFGDFWRKEADDKNYEEVQDMQ